MKFPCPNCGANIKVEEEWCGMPLDCPHDRCGATITVPLSRRDRNSFGKKIEGFFGSLFGKKKTYDEDE